jgi:hypothetical protein
MKKVTHLQCRVFDHDGNCIEQYYYSTAYQLYSDQIKQAENDIIAKHGNKWSRFTLIEAIYELLPPNFTANPTIVETSMPNQVKDNLKQQGQS